MICKNCGKEIKNDNINCKYCGYSVKMNDDTGSIGWFFLSCFIPIVGVILYFVWKSKKPNNAKKCLVGCILGFVISPILIFLLMFLMYFLFMILIMVTLALSHILFFIIHIFFY